MTSMVAEMKKIADGREAVVYEHGPDEVLKLYRHAGYADSMRAEAAAMTAVHEAGGNAPAALGFEEHDGLPGLVMERIEGLDLLSEIGRKPWTILGAGGLLGPLHAGLHETRAPDSLERTKSRLARHIERAARMPAALREAGLRMLDELPDGDRLCHGDFHPGNVMVTERGPVVIDWTNATRGEPTADLARTMLMIRLATLPPGTPMLLRVGDKFGRRVLNRHYVTSYRRARSYDPELLERWETAVAIHRLTEGILDEFPALQRFIAQRTGIHAEIPVDLRA